MPGSRSPDSPACPGTLACRPASPHAVGAAHGRKRGEVGGVGTILAGAAPPTARAPRGARRFGPAGVPVPATGARAGGLAHPGAAGRWRACPCAGAYKPVGGPPGARQCALSCTEESWPEKRQKAFTSLSRGCLICLGSSLQRSWPGMRSSRVVHLPGLPSWKGVGVVNRTSIRRSIRPVPPCAAAAPRSTRCPARPAR